MRGAGPHPGHMHYPPAHQNGYPHMNAQMFGEPAPPNMPSGHQSPMITDGKSDPYSYHPSYNNPGVAWPGHPPASLMEEENMYGGPAGVPPMGHSGMGHHGPNGMLTTPQNQKYPPYGA